MFPSEFLCGSESDLRPALVYEFLQKSARCKLKDLPPAINDDAQVWLIRGFSLAWSEPLVTFIPMEPSYVSVGE